VGADRIRNSEWGGGSRRGLAAPGDAAVLGIAN
jgi:hypothetical protein